MFCSNNSNHGNKARLAFSALFIAMMSLVGKAQQEEPKNPIVDYGEHHPAVFMVAIFVGVVLLVGVVYFIFKKTAKEPEAPQVNKPVQRTGRHPDRRYNSKKTLPQGGGFSRR